MDALIRQIAQRFNDNRPDVGAEAMEKAIRAVVFSGLSRSGFFKECAYLPNLDQRVKQNYYVCFLHSGKEEDLSLDEHLYVLGGELDAMGVEAVPQKTKTGFRIEIQQKDGSDAVFYEVFIYHKEVRDLRIRISYTQIPLPYELRSADELKEKLAAEIQKSFEKSVRTENAALTKKKGSKKTPNKKNQTQPAEEHWVQPSLF